jgi:hypothetical protein
VAAPLAEAIAQARELLLFGQELLAGGEPLLVRHDGVMHEVGHVLFLSYLVTS